MNNIIQDIRHGLIYIKRFRHRRGYGVHSPFAFKFITDIIYGSLPYYAFLDLDRNIKHHEPKRIRHLLFRVANEVQPQNIIVAGEEDSSSVYIRQAVKRASYTFISCDGKDAEAFLSKENDSSISLMLCINSWQHPDQIEEVFSRFAPTIDSNHSVALIRGIGYSHSMKRLWQRIKEDERTGITFDLYDLGIVFFDHRKIKQHYIVDF